MSREHSGKKLLVSTKDILHKSHFKFWIGKPNCHLTSIKLSAFLTMFMLNFVTVTIPVLFK